MAHIVQYWLVPSVFANGLHHCVNIGGYLFLCGAVARLVVYFYCNDAVVLGIAFAGISVFVADKPRKILLLSFDRVRI